MNNTYIICSYKNFYGEKILLNILFFVDIHCVEKVKYDKIVKYRWKL